MRTEIILCPKCKGQGTLELPDHKGYYDLVSCTSCLGSGRLIQTTIIKTKPFEKEK